MSTALRIAGRCLRASAVAVVALAAAPSAMGMLYLLREGRLLHVGERLAAALPLQQLAGDAGQPALRVAAAFLAAGLMAGILLGLLTRARVALVTGATAALAWALLVADGAASDAIASALRFGAQL
jgi:hypothetical protein